jgi:uncharacterized SAM-binding protein YcdF (DUF218 family)
VTRSRRRWAAILGTVLFVGACVVAFSHLGAWLLIDEPLRPARAIAVLGGGQAWRSIEAANLYKAGWAHEVWLTRGKRNEVDREMASIGFEPDSEEVLSRQVLQKLEVPEAAVRVIPQEVDNTLAELHAIADFAGAQPSAQSAAAPIILVTSKSHTRRVRVIWNTFAPRDSAIVRYKASDPFDPSHWWGTTTDALSAFREAFGIVNAWAGFPIAPRER